jgi:large subunit ribosomal protein L19
MSLIIDKIEKQQMKKNTPAVSVGDTVVVSKEIIEGAKKRIQKFQGLVIKMQNRYAKKTIVVRKFVGKIGVEKSFLIHSPLVTNVEIIKKGKVRRAKLYYLRDRLGKKAVTVKSAK